MELPQDKAGNGVYSIPLVRVPGARREEGEVSLYLTGTKRMEVGVAGLREITDSAASGPRPGLAQVPVRA